MITNVLQYLETTAQNHPQKKAFSDAGESITFSALVKEARALGSQITKYAEPGEPVAVLIDKSCAAIKAMMGVVYAGCFYSFLNKTQPDQRLDTIIKTLKPSLLIITDKTKNKADNLEYEEPVLNISSLDTTSQDKQLLNQIRAKHVDTNPLYCNFTSGSSGTPKGVAVCHRSVIDFIEHFTEIFGITKDDIIGNQAPLDFDVSVKDIYSGLKTGAEVVLIPKSYFTFLKKLLELLKSRKVTTLIWAVSALCIISTMKGLEYLLPENINKIMFSGEVMPLGHLSYWKKFYPNALFVNLYGPTEITCNCTYHIIERDFLQGESIPIGVPFPNEKVFLLDENEKLVTKPNAQGELCVAGTAVSLGYYNDAERTADAFVQNPLNPFYPETIYKTGDIAKYGTDGLLYFVGRKDFQIKHNGHRIELGEIDAAMEQLDGVTRALTLYIEDEKKLVSHFIGESNQNDIIFGLRKILPDYMIPNEIIPIEEFPLTNNGKLDRKKVIGDWKEKRNRGDY